MYFPIEDGIFQPAMLVYQRVCEIPNPLIRSPLIPILTSNVGHRIPPVYLLRDPPPLEEMRIQEHSSFGERTIPSALSPFWYCWWTKSCSTKDDYYPIIYRVLTIPGGAGFCPSTVRPERSRKSRKFPENHPNLKFISFFLGAPERLPKGPPKKKGSVGSSSKFRGSIEQKVFVGGKLAQPFHNKEILIPDKVPKDPRKHQWTIISDQCTNSHKRVNHSTEFFS